MSHNCRTYAPPENWSGMTVRLPESELRHIRQVLRLGEGAEVQVFDGAGRRASGRVGPAGDDTLSLANEPTVSQRRFMPVLFQAVPKAGRMDSVVEKVTELGIARIVPFLSSRTVVKLSQSQARKKVARWKRIAVSAAKQSGLDWVPGIDSVVRFDGLQDVFGQMDVVLAGSLEPGASHIRDVLRGLTAEIRKPGVLIGPEGDFTSVEMETARNWGAVPVCFGPTVLRTDTAAIYAASIFAYEFGK